MWSGMEGRGRTAPQATVLGDRSATGYTNSPRSSAQTKARVARIGRELSEVDLGPSGGLRWRFVAPHQCGPVAQLGARMNGIHEVTGSTPVWSTNFTPSHRRLHSAIGSRRPRPFRSGGSRSDS